MFAIIQTGEKQYKVAPKQKLKVEKVEGEKGANFIFDKVLLVADEKKAEIGAPYVNGAKVEAKILRQARSKKVIVFKYQSKTRRRNKAGHRQHFTEIEVMSIKQ
ncbi:50S ribosomal protein L21 [Candidatus Wolfebacteria bacterium]|nr:50S ribosomal protein L21 [Candidatus Wolfebacteria bacterium]